ncbi:MAG: hypothetical protein WDA59_01405 [Methanofastidiosum sp.]|jgi:hypothetical protein
MIEESKMKMPSKCKNCNMPDRFRPRHPGCCGVCIQNKNKKAKSKESEYKNEMD